ncbi:mechanosensitive ion channel family protein [Haloglomus halophilum]|uniref:mechanosensitive ion channel family protein n=1 Tax=Haloglomus halophilum TaxID=2962672 RepID=UPI0020C9EAC4|nr:mechanosensitive ion channel family protein [Haloglomus halophilum]
MLPVLPLQTLGQRIDTLFNNLIAGGVAFAGDLLVFVATVVVFYLLGRIVVVPVVTRLLKARNVQPTLAKPARKLTLAAVVFVAVAVGFAIAGFGDLLTSLATIAAALTLAIGFASQDVIGNLVAGVFLIADPKVRIGDWVEWNDEKGIIEDISFRVSRVRTFNNELVTVPNSELANTAITNPVAKDKLRVPFTFGVGYGDDLDHAQDVIIEEAERHDDILDEPAPSTRVTELADSYVGIQSRFWIDSPSRSDWAKVRSEYVQAVKERCDAEEIDMPYPHQQLLGGIDVEMQGGEVEAPADD